MTRWKQFILLLSVVGPGIITANVDNDAGGITTYSVAGARYGYGLLWMMPLVLLASSDDVGPRAALFQECLPRPVDRRRLAAALEGLPFVLRRRGLMMGLRFPAEGAGLMAAKMMYEAGVFCLPANNDTAVLQFLPPLVLSDGEVADLCGRVREAFGGLS